MASRDVNLVIKATDDSSKTVEAIVKALNDFTSGLDATAKKAEKGTSGFELLGKSLSGIDKVLRGMSDADRLAQSLDRASKGASDLSNAADKAGSEVTRLGEAVKAAGEGTAKFKSELAGVEAAINKEKTALDASVASHKKLNTAYVEGKAARAQLETQEANLTKTLATQEERLAKQAAKVEALSAAFASTETPTKRLTTQLDTATLSAQKTANAINETKLALASTKEQISAAGTAEAEYAAQVAASEASIIAQRQNISQLTDARKTATTTARQAAAAEAALVKEYTGAQDAFAGATTGATEAGEALNRLHANIEAGRAAFADLAKAAQGPLNDALRAQQSVVSKLNNEYQANRKSLADLSALMGAVGVPTREMSEQYDKLNQTSATVATNFKQQSDVLRTLRGELTNTATTTAELAAKEQLFASSLDAGTRALSASRQIVAQAAGETQKLVAANGNAGVSFSQIAKGAKEAAQATQELAEKTDESSEAYKRAANSSRETLSFTQRLKGEVLGLIVAYTGFQGVIDILSKTVDAYKTLEAATSRLNALHGGDQALVASDLDFTRRAADRLGIQFGALADEYTKFAASTKGTVIEGQKTRDIFLSIAQAGRVNKLSLEDMKGIFLAVTQIASKGRFQMEELSGQLGDRLPGALNILADGLGITVAELNKLTKAGAVSSDKLVQFAEELDKRYGGALAASLTTTTTALGMLQNATFEALVQFGKGGFIEGFTDLIRKLTEVLKSADFLTFAQNASSGFGILAKAIGIAVDNFRLLAAVAGGFATLKLVPIFLEWGRAIAGVSAATTGVAGTLQRVSSTVAPLEAAAGGAARGVGLLATALRLVTSSTGIGLIITAIGTGIAYWATATSDSTSAFVDSQRVLDQLKNSYDAVGGSVKEWAKSVDDVTKAQTAQALAEAQTALAAGKKAAQATTTSQLQMATSATRSLGQDPGFIQQAKELLQLQELFEQDAVSADLYKDALGNLRDEAVRPEIASIAQSMINNAEATQTQQTAVDNLKLAWVALNGTEEERKAAMDQLTGRTAANTKVVDDGTVQNEAYQKVLEKIQKTAPLIGEAFDDLKEHLLLDEAYNSAIKYAKTMGDVLRLTKQYNDTLAGMTAKSADKIFGSASTGLDASRALIRDRERFSGTAYQDTEGSDNHPGKFRAGFGSDTVTLSDGSVHQVTEGMTVTLEDANRDLDRRIGEYTNTLKETVGAGKFDSLTAQQQASLNSLVHNYGTLPKDIAEAVKSGSNDDIANAILHHQGDNEGINSQRRAIEASPFQTDDTEKQSKRIDQAFDKQTKLNEASQAETDSIAAKAAAQDEANDGLTKEAFIDKGIADLMRQNKDASADVIAKRREALGLAYDAKQVGKDALKDVKDAAGAEAVVNAKMSERNALQAQFKQQTATGDTAGAAETQTKITSLNSTIQQSIDKAREFYNALDDGDKKTAGLARLDALQTKLGLVAGATNKATEANKNASVASENVNALLAKRSALEGQLSGQLKAGDVSGATSTKSAITDLNSEIIKAIDNAEAMWKAIGGPAADAAITRLEAARIKAQDFKAEAKQTLVDWTKVGEQFAGGLTDAVGNFFEQVAEGTPIGEAARDAFLKFASDFLISIGKMILQQELLNLVRSFGGVFSQVGLGAAVLHGGGTVGATASSTNTGGRNVSAGLFAGAPRFHDGGLPGLKPGEVPAILKTGEEVLKGNDPRNILNGGAAASGQQQAAGGGPLQVRIVNSFDTADVVSQGLATVPGEQAIMNVIKTNRSAIRDLVNNG
jgi:tape measure domain-containing protein